MTATMERPERNITVGQLRQNPTRMLADVQNGESYVVTSHGHPIADVVPHTDGAWVPVERALAALSSSDAIGWAEELSEQRASQDLRDPWG
ncbi:type II toxin-antitoxin system Phd/YefM family antitoxin [Leifsonia sp. ZF2019]|uniref:type II toxin-antitoxin system Phd/YefM family antitoxin n=1 Tax=Leifsonia sp. ZF2019 TaxID=2781978 RepID=UPI001CBC565A|nr:type II toxin-antitoxin system prevent-host-death family antitoxin [Leifsonia sp. ZF2019]